jgi:hypothetical protein
VQLVSVIFGLALHNDFPRDMKLTNLDQEKKVKTIKIVLMYFTLSNIY